MKSDIIAHTNSLETFIMQKICLILLATLILTSCVHKMSVEQGNIIDQTKVAELHKGMTEEEVTNLMGSPVLMNTFSDNRVNYVYTYKPGYGAGVEKSVVLTFQGDRLKEINATKDQPFGK